MLVLRHLIAWVSKDHVLSQTPYCTNPHANPKPPMNLQLACETSMGPYRMRPLGAVSLLAGLSSTSTGAKHACVTFDGPSPSVSCQLPLPALLAAPLFS
mmetsp:Transcript_18621/g.29005  ORF Transcript_18621/g.29005 Transcript_18621/m.29005 type:complete len:99 (+) Transcript_18621:1132-1428(+)